MIRKTLHRTKRSTFIVNIPNKLFSGFPKPSGTGFFISPDGYFITANHVIDEAQVKDIQLTQPIVEVPSRYVGNGTLKLINVWDDLDIALLKADFESNPRKDTFKGEQFPFIDIEFREQKDGTPIYSYGFPFPNFEYQNAGEIKAGTQYISPRTTSAIISSKYDVIDPITPIGMPPKNYIIDKVLNEGNSGGPIVLSESGKVISVYIEYQTIEINQEVGPPNTVPSSYSVSSSLGYIRDYLEKILENYE